MLWQSDVGDATHRHGVQFFRPGDTRLEERVGDYLAEGLTSGASAVAITSPSRVALISHRLTLQGIDVAHAVQADRCIFLDAQETLDSIFASPGRSGTFDAIVGAALARAQRSAPAERARAYGDMVGLLWQQERTADLAELESIWNERLSDANFDLLCGYPIDVLGSRFRATELDIILRTHSHVLPSGDGLALDDALDRALEEVLGARADGVRRLVRANTYPEYPKLPRAEATILWLRENLTDKAEAIVRIAQRYAHS